MEFEESDSVKNSPSGFYLLNPEETLQAGHHGILKSKLSSRCALVAESGAKAGWFHRSCFPQPRWREAWPILLCQ